MESIKTYVTPEEAMELEEKLNEEEEDGCIYLVVHCANGGQSYLCVFDEKREFIADL